MPTKKDIVRKLESYPALQRTILQLEYELMDRPEIVSGDEIIEKMTFSHPEGDPIQTGQSDGKTAGIAQSYANAAEECNREYRDELNRELAKARLEAGRIKYYIDLLDAKQAKVLRALYLKRLPRPEAIKNTGFSASSFKRLLSAGLNELLEMYARVGD